MEKLKWIVVLITIIVVLNIGLLYWIYFQLKQQIVDNQKRIDNQTQTETVPDLTVALSPMLSSSCPASCKDQIDQLKKYVTSITPGVIKEVERIVSQPNNMSLVSSPAVKEYYIDFGNGTVDSTDWEDVPGLSKYINTNNYTNIQSVIFEASIRIPTGNGTVYVRLYNVTDGTAVDLSELSSEGSTSTLKQSKAINIAQGNKLYKVQMKNRMDYDVIVDSSRLKIMLQ